MMSSKEQQQHAGKLFIEGCQQKAWDATATRPHQAGSTTS